MSRITVAVFTYNRAEYLRVSLQSILDQTYSDMDIVVYDNASTDNTGSVVRAMGDKRITYIRNEKNLGQHGNFNRALSECKTEYIMIFHDDDIMMPHLVKTEVEIMDQNPGAAMAAQLFSATTHIDERGEIIQTPHLEGPSSIVYGPGEYIKDNIKRGYNTICFPAAIFRNKYIAEHNFRFDEKCGTAADWLFWFQINARCTIVGINIPVIKYRLHAGSCTSLSVQEDQRGKSHYYIEQWLNSNGYENTRGFHDQYLKNSLPELQSSYMQKDYVDLILSRIGELKEKYAWTFSTDKKKADAVLSPVISAVNERKADIHDYLRVRREFEKRTGIYLSKIYRIDWIIKNYIYSIFQKKYYHI